MSTQDVRLGIVTLLTIAPVGYDIWKAGLDIPRKTPNKEETE
jgi:hypothetical protein